MQKDLKLIKQELAKKLYRNQESVLFNIFLRRSDPHIASIIDSFQGSENKPLDETIAKYDRLSDLAKRILLHAIRGVSNMVRRDVLYLWEDVCSDTASWLHPPDQARLCVRICRMHKYHQHWHIVMKDFETLKGKSFISYIKGNSHRYSDFMVKMCERICGQ